MWPGVCTSVIAQVADLEHVARRVHDQIGVRAAGDALHAERFGCLDVHLGRDVVAREQRGDALDREAHHVPADMVGVVVGGEHAGEAHPVGVEELDQLVDAIGRVDRDRLTRRPVAEQVHEVDHLAGDRVAGREVAAREQLPEVEVGHDAQRRTCCTWGS